MLNSDFVVCYDKFKDFVKMTNLSYNIFLFLYKIGMPFCIKSLFTNCSNTLILDKLFDDHDYLIRYAVILNKHCSSETLYKVRKKEKDVIKYMILSHINVNNNIFEKLYNNSNYLIRLYIIRNNKCPNSILELAINDNNFYRFNLICNQNTPAYILEKLYKEFPYKVLEHPNCPDYLKILSK